AGYIHQSSSGIYTLMPLAQRTMDKIERIIDSEMQAVGGQKLALPSLLTPHNWVKTGRWASTGAELFTLKDRKHATLLLGPTHEEEVTAVVRDMVRGFRQYPLRLYQVTRKFRDEARPRAGLLRAREFVMKDMYSFDVTAERAVGTFYEMEQAYRRCFDRIGVPYRVAEADSGNIGGSLSKEFHFVSPLGEDTLLGCDACGYAANEERAQGRGGQGHDVYLTSVVEGSGGDAVCAGRRVVVVPGGHRPSVLKIGQAWKTAPGQRIELEPASLGSLDGLAALEPPLLPPLVDSSVSPALPPHIASALGGAHNGGEASALAGDWHVAQASDHCAKCPEGTLASQRAIEVGHIFYLGDKYSRAMDLTTLTAEQGRSHVQMGCYGIGVSRILQAAAECCSDGLRGSGLRWPLAIAPFLGVIVPLAGNEHAAGVYGMLGDLVVNGERVFRDNVAVDDRSYLSPGFRLNDAQLLGFPVTVVLGRAFAEKGEAEVQLRLPATMALPATTTTILGVELAHAGSGEYRARVHVGRLGDFLVAALEMATNRKHEGNE
ncbi:hypothetical protein LPJ53_005826, partial [Coemansia erecta]